MTLKRDLIPAYLTSLAAALLLLVLSLVGVWRPASLYPTVELQRSFAANDATTLVLVLPALLATMWLARRGRLAGLLFWPSVLLVVLYNAVAYLVALPPGLILGLNALVAVLAAFAFVRVLYSSDAGEVKRLLAGRVPERWTAAIITLLGLLFFLRAAFSLVSAVIASTPLPAAESGTLVADLFAGSLWIVAGVLLWRRRPSGYVLGAAVLGMAGLLFAGLLLFFFLQPILTEAPFAAADFLVVAVMSLVVFVPLAGFIRGVIRAGEADA